MWAVGIGSIVVGGTVLAPRQSFESAGERGDTLLVALSPLTLADDARSASPGAARTAINLRPGEARWLAAGLHKLHSTGSTPARYVTLEF